MSPTGAATGSSGAGVSPTDPPERRRYWLLILLAAILAAPPLWIGAAATAGALAAQIALGAWDRRRYRAANAIAPAPAGSLLLGAGDDGRPVLLSDRQLSAHALIVGASGAGKSTTLMTILTDHVRRGRPVLAIDMKGSPAFARQLAAAATAAGRPFRVWTPDGPGHWNPLQHGNATELKDKLIATERFTEPHYQRAAERYLQTLFQVLHDARPGHAPTLEDVVRLTDSRRMSSALRDVSPVLAERVRDYLAGLTLDQLSAIRGVGTRLAIISESHTGRYLAPASSSPETGTGPGELIDLRAALAGNEVVLFSLNSSTYGKLAGQLGTLVVQDLVTAVGDRLASEGASRAGTALIGIDEFSALDTGNVLALMARGREAGVSLLLATQELADLDRAARGLRDQVLGNAAVKIAHRQDVPSSAQTVAQMVGTETVWEHSYQTGRRVLVGEHDTGRGTRRRVEQFIVHPNEIKSLPTGHAVVITKIPRARARTVRVLPPGRDAGGPERG